MSVPPASAAAFALSFARQYIAKYMGHQQEQQLQQQQNQDQEEVINVEHDTDTAEWESNSTGFEFIFPIALNREFSAILLLNLFSFYQPHLTACSVQIKIEAMTCVR